MPWYTQPAALAIIATMRRPKIERTSHRYPLTVDHHHTYTGPAVAKLTSLYAMQIAEMDAIVPYPNGRIVSPSEVLGAVFGDPASGGGYRTALDDCADWAAIRDEVDAALSMRVAA